MKIVEEVIGGRARQGQWVACGCRQANFAEDDRIDNKHDDLPRVPGRA